MSLVVVEVQGVVLGEGEPATPEFIDKLHSGTNIAREKRRRE